MAGYEILELKVGLVYDVGSSLDDLAVLYRQKAGPGGEMKEASFLDPNLARIAEEEAKAGELKGDRGKSQKRDVAGEEVKQSDSDLKAKELKDAALAEKDKKADKQSSALAALFAPSSPPTPPSLSTSAKPDTSIWTPDAPASEAYAHLLSVLDRMQNSKNSGDRNTWQARQSGGQGEPFYRDSAGFETGILMTIEHGRAMYREKWGHRDCDIVAVGYRADDAWRVEHDWE